MLLEFSADESAIGRYELIGDRSTGSADWRQLIAAVINDRNNAATPGQIAMKFHRAIADWANELSGEHANVPLVLSGGCFQNGLLRTLIEAASSNRRWGLFVPQRIPPGDGGLASGQLAVADALRSAKSQQEF